MDPFSIFGLPRCFDVDLGLLTQRYFERQRYAHPDQLTGDLILSSDINRAYVTLKDPLKRAEILLQLEGIDVDALVVAPAILIQAMEWSESWELIIHDPVARKKFQLDVQEIYDDLFSRLSHAFQKNRMEEAAQIFLNLRYYSLNRMHTRV